MFVKNSYSILGIWLAISYNQISPLVPVMLIDWFVVLKNCSSHSVQLPGSVSLF